VNALELMRAAGHDLGAVAGRARMALREAGDRATALNALAQAERYYTEALALVGEDDLERPQLLFRQGKVMYMRREEGAAELNAARAGLIAAGDRETAAEAAVLLADISWRVGRHEELLEFISEARSLAEASSPSRVQITVLSHLSRYAMLSDRNDEAIEYGRESLRLAGQLGLDDLRSHALNNIGTARVASGDEGGLEDLEESIAIATQVNSIADVLRGHNNLATSHLMLGHMTRATEIFDETLRLSEHFGYHGFGRFVQGGSAIQNRYMTGDWDAALDRAEVFLAEVEGGSPHYQAPFSYSSRSLIRLGRGDSEGAEKDAELAVELARPLRDPQIVQTSLAKAAFVFLCVGNDARVKDVFGECFEGLKKIDRVGFAAIELHRVAWVARALAREAEVLELLEGQAVESPWLVTARAVAVGDLVQAADLLQEMRSVTDESFYRMQAAAQLVTEGRRAEADEQLRRALAFFRSVGATRYVREGEALLAASA
jgi:tetratricopeptide (TPR) repeat protein